MSSPLFIYRSPQDAIGLFDQFFGGLYFVKGIPLILQLGVVVAALLALLAAVGFTTTRKPSLRISSEVFSILAFLGLALLLFQPWDELFVNLRHSLNFKEANLFSFNRQTLAEGTVDFLPYFLIGLLGKISLPLIELAYLQGIVGGLLCFGAIRAWLKSWGFAEASPWAFFACLCFAPLALNSSHGFATTLFAATCLWSVYFIFCRKNSALGFSLLALLPLLRIEGAWLVFLVWIYWAHRTPKVKLSTQLFVLGLLALPTIALSVYRFEVFHQILPAPVRYKASLGNLFFFLMGMRNFVADLLSSNALSAIAVVVLSYFLTGSDSIFPKYSRGLFLCFLCFVLPYYIAGGDWFPSAWGRYLFPFSLFAFLFALAVSLRTFSMLSTTKRGVWAGLVVLILLLQTPFSFTASARLLSYAFTPRKVLANLSLKKNGRMNYRMQYLSELGVHLGKTTPPQSVIASSEVATIMYFAHRETLDCLGITSDELAKAPLRKTPKILRHFPEDAELPYLIFKRVNPKLVEEHHPDIVYTFDFLLPELLEKVPFDEITDADLALAYRRWEKRFRGLTGPLYGGVGSLLKLGYRPVIVLYHNKFGSLYFVSSNELQDHLRRLTAAGFSGEETKAQL